MKHKISWSEDHATVDEFRKITSQCQEIFINKMKDYGVSWQVMRSSSITDQIYIKAQRIRHLQEINTQKVPDDPRLDFVGIVNYAIIALIQLKRYTVCASPKKLLSQQEVLSAYEKIVESIAKLLGRKNHDYNTSWRDLRVSSMTDFILMKLLRIREIENNGTRSPHSEGIESGYMDIVNYAVFSLVLLKFGHTKEQT